MNGKYNDKSIGKKEEGQKIDNCIENM